MIRRISAGQGRARHVYRGEAYSVKPGGGKLCDPTTFDVANGEQKTVSLTVRMVYFEDDFVVSPNYDTETKKLLNVLTQATLTNVYDTIANTQVKLLVTFNRDPLDEITVLGPLPLPLSQTGVPASYIPTGGWKNGLYSFKYQLYADGVLTAETQEETLKVGRGGTASSLLIVFVILVLREEYEVKWGKTCHGASEAQRILVKLCVSVSP